jgi:hypothetical protein
MQKQVTHLTKHGVKQLSESADASRDFANVSMVLQVFDVSMYDEQERKKNVKARVNLSDGLSKVVTMVPDRVYMQMVSHFQPN